MGIKEEIIKMIVADVKKGVNSAREAIKSYGGVIAR